MVVWLASLACAVLATVSGLDVTSVCMLMTFALLTSSMSQAMRCEVVTAADGRVPILMPFSLYPTMFIVVVMVRLLTTEQFHFTGVLCILCSFSSAFVTHA